MHRMDYTVSDTIKYKRDSIGIVLGPAFVMLVNVKQDEEVENNQMELIFSMEELFENAEYVADGSIEEFMMPADERYYHVVASLERDIWRFRDSDPAQPLQFHTVNKMAREYPYAEFGDYTRDGDDAKFMVETQLKNKRMRINARRSISNWFYFGQRLGYTRYNIDYKGRPLELHSILQHHISVGIVPTMSNRVEKYAVVQGPALIFITDITDNCIQDDENENVKTFDVLHNEQPRPYVMLNMYFINLGESERIRKPILDTYKYRVAMISTPDDNDCTIQVRTLNDDDYIEPNAITEGNPPSVKPDATAASSSSSSSDSSSSDSDSDSDSDSKDAEADGHGLHGEEQNASTGNARYARSPLPRSRRFMSQQGPLMQQGSQGKGTGFLTLKDLNITSEFAEDDLWIVELFVHAYDGGLYSFVIYPNIRIKETMKDDTALLELKDQTRKSALKHLPYVPPQNVKYDFEKGEGKLYVVISDNTITERIYSKLLYVAFRIVGTLSAYGMSSRPPDAYEIFDSDMKDIFSFIDERTPSKSLQTMSLPLKPYEMKSEDDKKVMEEAKVVTSIIKNYRIRQRDTASASLGKTNKARKQNELEPKEE